MIWKYIRRVILLLIILTVVIFSYRYFGSVDWSKNHSKRVASLPLLSAEHHEGEYRMKVGSHEFLARVAGLQNEGPAVILLHGFPESSIMWTDLLNKAALKGYRVIAFDQRGYSPGARPKGVNNYHISHLTNDVLAVADQLGIDTFHLVGHDWGAVITWNFAMQYPERLHSITTLAIPHIGVFFDAIQNHPQQKLRSGYMKRLQTPIIPEYKFVANGQQFYKQMMAKNPEEYLEEYIALFAEHGAATATLNWYRALELSEIAENKIFAQKINRPTLFIWGTDDMVIAPEIIPQQKEWIDAPYKEVSLATGHGLIQSMPDTVITEILKHISL